MRTSAGVLLFRPDATGMSVLLAHPGGPFWSRRDDGAWSVPKGEFDGASESAREAAAREFREETGRDVPDGEWIDLGTVVQSRAKSVTAFAVCADFDVSTAVSNTVEMIWPPKSDRRIRFPEVDRLEWFDVSTARVKMLPGQQPLVDRLVEITTEC